MPTVNDLWLSYLKQELGLVSSNLSVNDLELSWLTGTISGSSMSSERRFKTGNYYSQELDGGNGTASPVLNDLSVFPFPVGEQFTADRIACAIVTAFAATGVLRLGIYNSDTDGIPSTLLFGSGTVASDTTGLKEFTISQQLTKGLYWVGICFQVTVATGAVRSIGGSTSKYVGIADPTMNGTQAGYVQAGVTGALPSTFVPTFTAGGIFSGQAPKISLRSA